MGHFKLVGALAVVAFLGGCVGQDIERMRSVEPTGDAFTRALTEEYREITVFEADEMYDWIHAGYFARKGQRAAAGEVVEPEFVENWDLPSDKVDELAQARFRLVELLDASARSKFPGLAGHAQGRYDCWIEQQQENHQPDHIAACRDQFFAALAELEIAMAPKVEVPEPPAAAVEVEAYVVFFAFDKSDLSDAAQAAIADAIVSSREMGLNEFSVTGYTDTVGSEEYNLKLSLRRANAVKDALVAGGIDPANISVAGRGKNDLAVPTADQVREQANRRAEIVIQ